MRELIIGADGFIGARLLALSGGEGSSRRNPCYHGLHYLDLAAPGEIPACNIAYVCAGANGAKACEGSQAAFAANVDGPIAVAQRVTARGGFVVVISSMSVEWLSTAYQRQKLAAETVLRTMPGVGIVRAGRVTRDNLDDLCATLLRVGRGRIAGVTRWGSDELAYQK